MERLMATMPRDTNVATLTPRDAAAMPDRIPAVSKAKLTPPRAPAHLATTQRHREWLDRVLAHDITLVMAPLAYGKTVFAGQLYAETLGAGSAAGWVSCYRLPAGRLAAHVFESVRLATGDRPDTCWPATPEALAVDLANHIHDREDPILLCLDDIDQLDHDADRDFLRHLIANGSTNLHLVATCRDDRRLPSDLVEPRGTVLRVDARALRARDAEVLDYLRAQGIALGSRRGRALNEALKGWWGALDRVATGLRGEGWNAGPEDWPRRCAQWITPLFREPLDALPERHRAVLARCAVAPTLTADLAVALTGDEAAGTLLRDIAQSGPFVETVRGTTDRFTIHPVLRAALLADGSEVSGAIVAKLRAMAIDFHVDCDEPEQAIAIAGASGDVEDDAALIARLGMRALERSGPCGLVDALGRLPPARIADDAALTRVMHWTAALCGQDPPSIIGDTAAAERVMLDAIRLAAAGETPSIDLADETIASTDFGARLVTAMSADRVLRTGDHRGAQALLRPIVRHGRTAGLGFAEAVALVSMADLHRVQGRPADAERLLQEGFADIPSGVGRHSGTAAMIAVALADHLYLRNDVAMAGALIDDALPVLARTGLPDFLLRGYRVAIRVAVASARPEEALALIEAAEEIGADRGLPLLTALGAVERLRLHVPLAVSLDEILLPDAEEAAVAVPGSIAARTFALLSEARAFEAIANLDRPRLTIVANRLLTLAERVDDFELRVVGTLLNVLPQLSGRCDRMVEIDTVKFLNRAAGIGYVRPILDLLEITGVRTSQDFNRGDYSAGSFLALLRLSRPGDGESLRPPPVTGSAFSFFTAREMEIVNALNEGETNKVIARKLGVTPETVKWHMKSLMRKLRASSREEVVSNALVLGVALDRGEHR